MRRKSSIAAAILIGCMVAAGARADVANASFGQLRDGSAVTVYTITNKPGSSLRVMTYGAAIVSLTMPDRAGKPADIVLGFPSIDGYLRNDPFFGAIVGRFANRIGGATFPLDGAAIKITANDRGNTLHGGRRGFDKVNWTAAKIDDRTVELTYLSKDGEEGFPGALTAHVRYSLDDDNRMKIEYTATTDKDTVVNLTNHSYYNLAGAGSGDVLKNELTIDADRFTPVTAQSIVTGQFADVANTPFDFRTPRPIGQHIADANEQLRFGNGYDHNFVLNHPEGMHHAATVYEPTSGRVLDITTDQPGIQFYSGNGLDGSITGKDGKRYPQHAAFCLEPQHFPDSPNHPDFPSAELKPGETFHSVSLYQFTTRAAAATEPQSH